MKQPKLFSDPTFSQSAWKSVAAKSIRMGWPNGLLEAGKHLNRSTMKALLLCGIFEDVFPAESEVAACMDELERFDYEALCSRETIHGRGHVLERSRKAPKARIEQMLDSDAGVRKIRAAAHKKGIHLYLPPRALLCIAQWLSVGPQDASIERSVDDTRWISMPAAMIDEHTIEGKRSGIKVTVLSGHRGNHMRLCERVMREGWDGIRREVHGTSFDRGPRGIDILELMKSKRAVEKAHSRKPKVQRLGPNRYGVKGEHGVYEVRIEPKGNSEIVRCACPSRFACYIAVAAAERYLHDKKAA